MCRRFVLKKFGRAEMSGMRVIRWHRGLNGVIISDWLPQPAVWVKH